MLHSIGILYVFLKFLRTTAIKSSELSSIVWTRAVLSRCNIAGTNALQQSLIIKLLSIYGEAKACSNQLCNSLSKIIGATGRHH